MASVQELYRSRLAAIDERVSGRLSTINQSQERFEDILNGETVKLTTAQPADGDVILSEEAASDPMKAMMQMMSASMAMGSFSGSGESGGSGMGSAVSSMMSMMMMQQLFDKLGDLVGGDKNAVAETASAPVAEVEAEAAVEAVAEAVVETADPAEDATFPNSLAEATAFDDIIYRAAEEYQVDPDLIHGVIQAESGYRPGAVSRVGAQGMMQLMPGTANELGVEDPFDPEQNIMGGVAYLSQMLERFNGDIRLALAAYNSGPNRVESYGITSSQNQEEYRRISQGVRGYVDKVLGYADARVLG